jgi:membrane protein
MSEPDPSESQDGGGGGRISRSRRELRRRADATRTRYRGSAAEHAWGRLSAMDFINQAMQFAGLLLLAFLPFLIVISSLAGRDAASTVARHLGLNPQATDIVRMVFNPASKTAAAVNIRGIIFAAFGGIGTAATLQALYERIHDLPSRGMKDLHRQLVWIASMLGLAALVGWLGPHIRSVSAGPVLLAVVAFILASAFFFFTMWLLLAGRVPWRRLLAPAIATGVFWVGLGVFSKFFFSNTVIGDYREYGAIGVAIALMSWLIAVGVVLILGAVVGMVWQERGLSFAAAFRRLVRPRRRRPQSRGEAGTR